MRYTYSCLAATLAACASTFAGQPVAKEIVEKEEKSLCDTIFSLPTLYQNKDNDVLQKFAIIGRYHGQYYFLDSNQGNADDWENRRARLGASAELFHFLKFSFNFNVDVEGEGRFFEDLEDAVAEIKLNENFKLSIGKQKAPITHEWRTSSNKIVTFERSRIVNQTVPDKMGGALLSYKKENWLIDLGAYTNSVDEDWAYPTFDGGSSYFASLGYKSAAGLTRLEYLYSDLDPNVDNTQTRGYEHVVSLNHNFEWDRLGIVADAIYASGDAGDVVGLIILPTYDITDKLKLVTRYQVATSDSDSGFSLQSRYEREAPDLVTSKGDFYQALYAGLNYYICGDNLKLMGGVEYTDFDQASGGSYDAWTVFGGVRVSF